MKVGGSRRDFIRRSLFGAAITGLLSRAASTSAKTESRRVDRRQFGGIGADVSILGPGLGAAFMDGYERNLDAGHALLESALAHIDLYHLHDIQVEVQGQWRSKIKAHRTKTHLRISVGSPHPNAG